MASEIISDISLINLSISFGVTINSVSFGNIVTVGTPIAITGMPNEF